MIKPDSLRKAIEEVLPQLQIDSSRLKIWIDQGSASGRMTAALGFTWSYKLSMLIEGMVENPSIIAIAIMQWLRVNQPALLTPGNTAFTFDVDIIDNKAWDLGIEIDLEEPVHAEQREDGGYNMLHLPEPDPLFDDDVPLGAGDPDFEEAWLVSEGVVGAEKLIPDEPPLGADVQPPGAVPP